MSSTASLPPGAIVHDRYEIHSMVGEGGMAKVFRATDLGTGQGVALKLLSPRSQARGPMLRALFEREFLVLSQLTHPRIVAAYDYGVDALGPYYTMELLDGSDLQGLAPLPYPRASALGRDVCSALSLIHSRRMVYRDLSPHNVRCTADGLAKLIDFGALAPVGPREALVGTLPCVAPEAVAREALDARTDLYAFGATLYYTLSGRHAFPARSLEELKEHWKLRPPKLSELVPEVPEALDQLVSDLLEADPARRPQSAAEVMERLRAIGQLADDESLAVRSAYLDKPSLVGREQAMQSFQEHASRAKEGRGRSVHLSGPSGAGRSRLLETLTLDAKQRGWSVLQADASALEAGDYAGAAALGRSLLRAMPHLARAHAEPQLGVLAHVVPELLQGRPDASLAPFSSPEARHRKLQPALREWLTQIAAERPLLIAVDDVHRWDAPSASLLALLARGARRHRLLVLTTQPLDELTSDDNQRALAQLARAAQQITVGPLTPELTHSLLGSVFGEVPNLETTARQVHQITGGSPRDIMTFAQHLVSEGAVRYEAGAWALPQLLSATDLPATMAEGLVRRLRKLSREARTLGYAISREPAISFELADCKQLLPDAAHDALSAALQVLNEEEVLSVHDGHYRCVQRRWTAPLHEVLSADERRAAHLGLAQVFQLRQDGFRHAAWLLRAGEHERALTVLTEFALTSRAVTDKDPVAYNALLRSLPADWIELCSQALALHEHQGRPARERFALLSRVAGFIGRSGQAVHGVRVIEPLLRRLEQDSGLAYFEALPADIPPAMRIPSALGQAKERYIAASEHERVLDPGAAIKELASVLVAALGSIATTSDFSAFRLLPSLAPITALSPSLLLVHQLAQGLRYRLAGRSEDAIATYQALLERLDQPDRAGLEPAHHFYTKLRVMGAVGTLEAMMGRASCLRWVEQVEGAAQYEHVGAVISYLYHLWQGNSREARHFRRRYEVLQLELNSSTDLQYVFSELCVHALTSNMTGVRRAADALEPLAEIHAAARAALHYARGEYHRIRGDLKASLAQLEQALALMRPGEHLVWANAAGAHVRVLSELGRDEQARALGEAYLASAEAQELGYLKNCIRCPLSRALAKVGEEARARALAQSAIDLCTDLGMTGVNAELAHEAFVTVAAVAGDLASVEQQLERCSALFRRRFAGNENGLPAWQGVSRADHTPQLHDSLHDLGTQFSSCLLEFRTVAERAERGLSFLLDHLSLPGGSVYLSTADGVACVASAGEIAGEEVLRPWVLDRLEREQATQHTAVVTTDVTESITGGEPADDESFPSELDAYTPVLLAHYDERGFTITGLMALRGALGGQLEEAQRLGAQLSVRLCDLIRAPGAGARL